ncbi:unnamed protein product [Bemisia tabaci]|uniref:Uncharacterized protein n=1 Tax=Bemisia tabaci TaxID=7038 RepID=A0A9P0ABB9_BEMTA|nr:unnamed protein product [Bemisia tabaci]
MDGQVRCLRSKALLVFWLICVSVVSIEMVEVPESGSTSGVYIVYTELPQEQPGVLSVQPSMTYQLASGSRTGGLF